jgi:hypothetical protein
VTSQFPLDRIEIVRDGKVIAAARAAGERLAAEIEQVVPFERSGWVAVRASGPPHRDQPGGSPFGHTGAVYVEVAGRPADASEDAAYFVAWIDRLAADVRRRGRIPTRSRAHVESQLAAARAVYEKLAAKR